MVRGGAGSPPPHPPGPRDVLEEGEWGSEGGLKGVLGGTPLLPGSPYGPRRRQAETFEA